jgi:glycosyltransferase involved in cell wall biosynthesis
VIKANENKELQVYVVIPAYKVNDHILGVIQSIGPEVHGIVVVDDECPQGSGKRVLSENVDSRVEVIFHVRNTGVGGAVKTGYLRALEKGSDIIVKIDGDGQMDPSKIDELITPIKNLEADYTKGNRFSDVETIRVMPKIRIFGNLGLSFLTKLSSGYWRVFDPTNGFTAITRDALAKIPLTKIDNGYFFESDMLFRLNVARSRVRDIPIPPIYGEETSNLSIYKALIHFPYKHFRNLLKRIFYTYYLKDFNMASIELPLGVFLSSAGVVIGAYSWFEAVVSGTPTPPGTLILVAVCLLAGLQLVLAFLSYDTNRQLD